jgi:hypothetical protein
MAADGRTNSGGHEENRVERGAILDLAAAKLEDRTCRLFQHQLGYARKNARFALVTFGVGLRDDEADGQKIAPEAGAYFPLQVRERVSVTGGRRYLELLFIDVHLILRRKA